MKKLAIVSLVIISFVCLLTSCGASWEQTKKNFSADYNGGLERKIIVKNQLTDEVVWEHEGKSYISDGSTVGDVTIIYYDEAGESKKADFIGQFYGVSSIEL